MFGGQYGEDLILKLVFKNIQTGFLVDVGSADGGINSNSYMLLQRPGWKGILIEPEADHYTGLLERYKDRQGVTFVNCGIGKAIGMQTFYRGGQVSTFKEDTKKACEDMHDIKYIETKVQMRNLTDVLQELNAPKHIDFMSIDCEGMDREVWRTLDLEIYCPKLVCIEGKGHMMLGYREFCRTVGNTFYMREDVCHSLELE